MSRQCAKKNENRWFLRVHNSWQVIKIYIIHAQQFHQMSLVMNCSDFCIVINTLSLNTYIETRKGAKIPGLIGDQQIPSLRSDAMERRINTFVLP